MLREETIDCIEDLLRMPLFKMGFLEFFRKMQEEGIVAAKRYWDLSHDTNFLIPRAPEIFEKMIDFYIILGFVSRSRYEKLLEENRNLKEENTVLRNTIREMQDSLLACPTENNMQEGRQGTAVTQGYQEIQQERQVVS